MTKPLEPLGPPATARCVWCDAAWCLPDGEGGLVWVVDASTPDCPHETLEGRT